jgi:acyl dehydratase
LTVADQIVGAEVEPGDEIGPLIKSPDLEEVRTFLNVWRRGEEDSNLNRRFTDTATAQRDGFSSPIVPGQMSFAYLSQLLTTWMGPRGQLRNLDLNYRRPTRHGEELRCIGLITDTREEGEHTVVKLDVFIEDPRGDRPTQGVAEVVIPTSL